MVLTRLRLRLVWDDFRGSNFQHSVKRRLLEFLSPLVSGGPKPNLADLAVFGFLRPICRLRSGKDMVNHTRIGEWYARKEKAVGETSRIKEQ
ncbi:hypothetical protein Dimus_030318, partial [Dionaea muscipula]